MALTQGTKIWRLGPPANGAFGYQVAAGEQVWRGSIVALNAAGTLQRVQTAGSIVVVGLCAEDYDNTANAAPSPDYVPVERGWWNLAPNGAKAANINQPVYATDDATVTLTPPVAASMDAGNTGNGTFNTPTVSNTVAVETGDYVISFTSSSAFNVTDPLGRALPAGTVGTAYSEAGIGFTITAGATAFVAGDGAVVSVGGLLVGTLSGFDKGTPYVRIQGS